MSTFDIVKVRKACERCLKDILSKRADMMERLASATDRTQLERYQAAADVCGWRHDDEAKVRLIIAYMDDMSENGGDLKVMLTLEDYRPLKGYFDKGLL